MTLAKEVEVPSSAASLIELEVDADAAYMYYMFENDSNYSGIKELRWEVVWRQCFLHIVVGKHDAGNPCLSD